MDDSYDVLLYLCIEVNAHPFTLSPLITPTEVEALGRTCPTGCDVQDIDKEFVQFKVYWQSNVGFRLRSARSL
jgi:hypothetical protein